MGSTENTNVVDTRLRDLLERYLRLRSKNESADNFAVHLDEDTLTAFNEGNLTFREADHAVSHLADCSFCRHKTAELVRLDLAFAETDASTPAAESREPAKVSEVLSGILSRLFGGGDAAVFAHEEKKEDEKEKSSAGEKDKE